MNTNEERAAFEEYFNGDFAPQPIASSGYEVAWAACTAVRCTCKPVEMLTCERMVDGPEPKPQAPASDEVRQALEEQPQNGPWRCFFCDEVFTDAEAATEHFGKGQHFGSPGCQIDIAEYRRMQEAHRRQCEEDTDWHRAFYKLGSDHVQAMRRHGDKEYARGLRDGANLPADSSERAALAASAGKTEASPVQPEEVQEPSEWLERAMEKSELFGRLCLETEQMGATTLFAAAREVAREALRTHLSARLLPPQGWQLVPVEPTPEMLAAAWRAVRPGRPPQDDVDAYRAMLAAAPKE
jgi:hypothetical protein